MPSAKKQLHLLQWRCQQIVAYVLGPHNHEGIWQPHVHTAGLKQGLWQWLWQIKFKLIIKWSWAASSLLSYCRLSRRQDWTRQKMHLQDQAASVQGVQCSSKNDWLMSLMSCRSCHYDQLWLSNAPDARRVHQKFHAPLIQWLQQAEVEAASIAPCQCLPLRLRQPMLKTKIRQSSRVESSHQSDSVRQSDSDTYTVAIAMQEWQSESLSLSLRLRVWEVWESETLRVWVWVWESESLSLRVWESETERVWVWVLSPESAIVIGYHIGYQHRSWMSCFKYDAMQW